MFSRISQEIGHLFLNVLAWAPLLPSTKSLYYSHPLSPSQCMIKLRIWETSQQSPVWFPIGGQLLNPIHWATCILSRLVAFQSTRLSLLSQVLVSQQNCCWPPFSSLSSSFHHPNCCQSDLTGTFDPLLIIFKYNLKFLGMVCRTLSYLVSGKMHPHFHLLSHFPPSHPFPHQFPFH